MLSTVACQASSDSFVMLEFDKHQTVQFDGIWFHGVGGCDFTQGVELCGNFVHFFVDCGFELCDKCWGGMSGFDEGECLGEGYLIWGMGRWVKFVVLGLHGWLGKYGFVGSGCQWNDGFEVFSCDQHCFLFEDGFALYCVDGFGDEGTKEVGGSLDLVHW